MKRWPALIWEETGASAVEYAILASGIALAIAAAVAFMGQAVVGLYSKFTLR